MKNNNKVASPNGNVGAADKVKPSVQSKSMASKKKQYKGVRMRSWGSWVSEIRAPNQKTRIWLGSYSTPEAAARAYDAALLCLKGSSANFNFPIASSAHIPTTLMSPKSIQRVAAAAANATTPTSSPSPSTPSTSMSSSSSTSSSSLLPSSPSDYQDEIFASCTTEDPSHSIDPWTDFCDFLSPKYVDQMLCSCSFFAPPCLEECDEEVDIRLWSFC